MAKPLPREPQLVSYDELSGHFAEYFATAADVDNWLQQRVTYLRFKQREGENHQTEIGKIEAWWLANRTGPI